MLISLLGLIAASSTIAQEPGSPPQDGWEIGAVSFELTINGKRGKSEPIPTVFTVREDVPGVLFMCDQSSYRVRIAEKPMPMHNVVHGTQKRNVPNVRFFLFLDDEKVLTGRADRWTQLDAIAPVGREPAANLFNAIITGQKAEYALRREKNRQPLHLPPVDENFRAFADACKALQSSSE